MAVINWNCPKEEWIVFQGMLERRIKEACEAFNEVDRDKNFKD